MVSIQTGGTLAFWSGDPRRLVEDVGAAKPTHFPSVPRVFEKIHARVLARGEEGSAVKQRLFSWAIATGRRARPALRAGNAPAAILLALVAFAVLLAPLGFTVVMLGLLLGLFFAYDREHALAKLVVALVGSAGTHYVFERFLRVPLPDATLPALRSLGF